MMRLRGLFVLVVWLASVCSVSAAEQGGTRRGVSCSMVRYYVAKYTAAKAEAWARKKGATDAEIEWAYGCLKGGTAAVHSAQN
jgi:hypothetical protein